MVVVVAALHLRLVLHLGMVLAVLMRLMQPVFCNGASGIAGRALRRIFWGNLGIGYCQKELPLHLWIRRWVLVWWFLLQSGRLAVQLAW